MSTGGAQGFEAAAQTWPTLESPFTTLLTVDVTAGFDVPVTEAVKLARSSGATAADAGDADTETGALLAKSGPVAVIMPTVEFPPETPLALQLTATLDAPAPVTVALKFTAAAGARF